MATTSAHVLTLLAAGRGSTALVVPHQGLRYTYKELLERTATVAASLKGLGYNPGDTLAMCLNSCAENVITQLAASIAGYSVATVKTADALPNCMVELDGR